MRHCMHTAEECAALCHNKKKKSVIDSVITDFLFNFASVMTAGCQ